MTVINAAQASVKTVGDPNAYYESAKPLWDRSRAVCNGERFVKDFDSGIDKYSFSNLLIPFSPSMTEEQYRFYKAEAELPGISAQFAKMLVGGLLRKQPILELPEDTPQEVYNWILNEFGKDDSPLSSFLDTALWEEIQTSRAWVFVDYPKIHNPENLTREELLEYKPYPILYKADSIINWRIRETKKGKSILDRVIIRGFSKEYLNNEFHPTYIDTVWVHELDDDGLYQIRKFVKRAVESNVPISNGLEVRDVTKEKYQFEFEELITDIMFNGERLPFIPGWPLNGSVDVSEPLLSTIIDKEISLYNKISRRNHLLYGAATYTPIIASDMTDEEFDDIVGGGLGSWIRLRQGDTATVLETPTAALADMDRAIAASIEEIARLGIRMLTPEANQSGVALEIRNAAQTAQLGTLNTKISNIMKQIICFMINWRFGIELPSSAVKFNLSADFDRLPLGSDWLRLATEWYQQGLIPRSVWLQLLKQNELIDTNYNDELAVQEINSDPLILPTGTTEGENQLQQY